MQASQDDARLIVPLADVQEADLAAVGAKALNLAKLLRGGFAVPAGFCVTGRAYREHVEAAGRAARIAEAAAALRDGSRSDGGEALAEVRGLIREDPLAAGLEEAIRQHWRALGGVPVAVRSSATAEDLAEHSFAGQYETFLSVADLPACLGRVRDCWASLWSRRGSEYLRQAGIDPLGVDMAVIVQVLVQADTAGVLFTADPVAGRRDCVVIEAAAGLGDAVVRGKRTPQRVVVSRRVVLVEERSAAAGPQPPRVDDAAARRLARLGVQVEALFGGAPQDVEWAVADGQVYLLQTRPITALPPRPQRAWADRQIWTNANLREAAPDVMTPMTYSFVLPLLEPMFGPMLRKTGIHIRPNDLADLVGGRVYFNVNTLVAIVKALPTLRQPDLGVLFGGGGREGDEPVELNLPDEDLPDLRMGLWRRLVRLPDFALWWLRQPMRLGPRVLAEAKARTAAAEAVPWPSLPDGQLIREFHAAADGLKQLLLGMPILTTGMGCCMALVGLCRRWFGTQEGQTIANRLLAGLGGLEDAEAGIELWRMAAAAGEHEALAEAVRGESRFESLRRRIAGTDAGDALLAAWSRFMQAHGHHARGEIDLANARWREMPDYVLGLLRSHLAGLGRVDPVAQARELASRRRRLAEQCRRRLWCPIRRLAFDALVRRSQQALRFRETSKSVAVRSLSVLRWMLLEFGERFARRGILARRDDVFFLEFDELAPLAAGAADVRPREAVARRRAEYDRNVAADPPPVVFGRFDPTRHAAPVADRGASVFRGFAVSPGVVRGKARAICHAGDGHVLPGEVLVAPFTDPGWTPYFLNAAAIVTEQGGVLSHGSIVAREYGIPCVANVGPITQAVRTGQTLEVDGDRGVVTVVA